MGAQYLNKDSADVGVGVEVESKLKIEGQRIRRRKVVWAKLNLMVARGLEW